MISTDNYIIVKQLDADNKYRLTCIAPDEETESNENFDPVYWVCYKAAKFIAFDDCTDDEVVAVVANGRELTYTGWQPGMGFTFIDTKTKEVVFDHSYPSWDH